MQHHVAVAVALGSNLGDRRAHLDFAVARLRTILTDLRVSPAIRHRAGRRRPAAAVPEWRRRRETSLGRPRELLDALLAIERERGRERPFPGAPRTLDLDLILYGASSSTSRAWSCRIPGSASGVFVLEPLAEIAPDLVDPVTGLTMRDLLARLAP